MSHAPGLSGTPESGQCSSAVKSASCASSSGRPTSRTMRASPAISLGDSIRQTALIVRWTALSDTDALIYARSRRAARAITGALHPIDSALAPRAAEYLLGLPAGADSYPECQVRSDLTREIFKHFPEIPKHEALSPELREKIAEASKGEWMSDVLGCIARILVRDVIC